MKKTLLSAVGALLLLTGCASETVTTCEAYKQAFRQNEVFFATDKAELTPESKKVLDGQIEWLKENPNKKVIIQGYADPRGTAEYNMMLGQKRADAVKNYMVKNGVKASRISVVSFGDSELATTQNTPQGWKESRRTVTVIVTE